MAKPTLKVTDSKTGITYTAPPPAPYLVLRLETRSPIVAERNARSALAYSVRAVALLRAQTACLEAHEAGVAPEAWPSEAVALLAGTKATSHSWNSSMAGVVNELQDLEFNLFHEKAAFSRHLTTAANYREYLAHGLDNLDKARTAVEEQVWTTPASAWSSWHHSLKDARMAQPYSSPENEVRYLEVATGQPI